MIKTRQPIYDEPHEDPVRRWTVVVAHPDPASLPDGPWTYIAYVEADDVIAAIDRGEREAWLARPGEERGRRRDWVALVVFDGQHRFHHQR